VAWYWLVPCRIPDFLTKSFGAFDKSSADRALANPNCRSPLLSSKGKSSSRMVGNSYLIV